MKSTSLLTLLAVSAVFLGCTGSASADVVRFHYSQANICGHTSLKPNPNGSKGKWQPWIMGIRRDSYYCEPKATHMVTYRHPFSCRNVTVPMALPQGTPRIAYLTDTIVYSYTTYVIRVEFLRDGSVDVVYNSGLFRPIQ